MLSQDSLKGSGSEELLLEALTSAWFCGFWKLSPRFSTQLWRPYLSSSSRRAAKASFPLSRSHSCSRLVLEASRALCAVASILVAVSWWLCELT